MKKFTILVEGGRSLVFKGKFLGGAMGDPWHYYEDDKGSIYNVNRDCIVAVIEESI